LKKFGKCKRCGKEGEIYYYKGFYYCEKCFNELTSHLVPFNEIFR